MSIPNPNSIGSSISGDVKAQLDARQTFMKSGVKDVEWHRSLTSRVAWVKLSSSVNFDGSPALAQNTELSATGVRGTSDLNPAYDLNTQKLGFRAVPGITSVSIKHKNRFGTLREASVQFRAFTLEQLDDLEQLYLRPGMSVLLEWGHSTGIDTDGNRITQIETIGDKFYKDGITKESILYKLKELRSTNGHNYEGMFGFVQNFSWSYNPDGSYTCSVSIVSIGVILESLFMAIPSKPIKVGGDTKETDGETTLKQKSPIHNILLTTQEVFNYSKDGEQAFSKLPLPSIIKAELTTKGFASFEVNVTGEGGEQALGNLSFIKFGALVNILDYLFTLKTTQNSESISRLTIHPLEVFNTFDRHFSNNPGVVMKGKVTTPSEIEKNLGFKPGYGTLTEELSKLTDNADQIANLWLGVDTVLSAVDSAITPEGNLELLQMLQNLCTKVNVSLGGITELDLAYEEEQDTYFIVDRKVVQKPDSEKPRTLNLTGLSTTVRSISLQSKISPQLSTLIAITAQNSETITSVGLEADNLFKWNRNLTDRVFPDKVQTGEYETTTKVKLHVDAMVAFKKVVNNFILNNVYESSDFENVRSAHRTITQITYRESRAEDAPSPGIIPFELTLQLDGIGGLKIGQTFRIGGEVLPSKYRNEVGFIIVGVDQNISNNTWLTSVRAQTIKI